MKRVVSTILLIALFLSAISITVYAENSKSVQVVSTDDNYLIYVEGLTSKSFQYAVSDKSDLSIDSIELNYLVSTKDENDNYVAVVEDDTKNYLYVKDGDELTIIEVDFDKAITDKDLAKVGKLTETIDTEITNIEERNETIGQVQYIETVGGLKITEVGNGEYEYIDMKLPATSYSDLKELITKMTSDEDLDMYKKIELAKEINSLFNQVIDETNTEGLWQAVENKTIKQRDDAEKGDEYAILIKKTEGTTETYDIKFLVSDKKTSEKETEEVEKVVKSTTKLPVTFDSAMIYSSIVLVVAIVAIVIVLAAKKKAKKENK